MTIADASQRARSWFASMQGLVALLLMLLGCTYLGYFHGMSQNAQVALVRSELHSEQMHNVSQAYRSALDSKDEALAAKDDVIATLSDRLARAAEASASASESAQRAAEAVEKTATEDPT